MHPVSDTWGTRFIKASFSTLKKPTEKVFLILALLFSTLCFLFATQYWFRRKTESFSFWDVKLACEKPRVYEIVELDIRLNGNLNNPFDENEVNVTSEITLPNGVKWNIQAFFYQDYERRIVNDWEILLPSGEPFWKLRFTPMLEGNHTVVLRVYSRGKPTDSRELSLVVEGYSHDPGFVRFNGSYLVCDNGSELFLIGQNVCWYTGSRKTFDYDVWFEKMAENGMNYARIWMAPWAFAVEWSDRVGRYDLKEAWRLDYVLRLAEEKGIYVMLCLVNHGQLRAGENWSGNPYNRVRGGPLSSPEQFFTDPVAKDLFKKRLRYLVSRYAYSTHLLAWEFFNEVDLTDNYNPSNVADWHKEMAGYLRSIDPYKHLVTTSFGGPREGDLVWRASGLDFTQTHMYGPDIKDLARAISSEIKRKLLTYGKPTLFGEFGADWRWFDSPLYYKDKEGVEIHEGIWASLMSGSFGTAMLWWWDVYVDSYNLYYHYNALRKFITNISFSKSGLTELKIVDYDKINTTNVNFEIFGLRNGTFAMGWVRNKDYNWFNAISNTTLKMVGGVYVELLDFNPGSYMFEIWDTYTGERMRLSEVESSDGRLLVEIPVFLKDIAFKIIRVKDNT
ncbi:MAG: cellulase family glycosylhydrolase [Crenarchaeota archaeon]|nr:cellulase family glycosylhydrolase [Thermoproteota archaeon]